MIKATRTDKSEKQCSTDENIARGKKIAESNKRDKIILVGVCSAQELSATVDHRVKAGREERTGWKKDREQEKLEHA